MNGRETITIRSALSAAKKGKNVVVVCMSADDARRVFRRAVEAAEDLTVQNCELRGPDGNYLKFVHPLDNLRGLRPDFIYRHRPPTEKRPCCSRSPSRTSSGSPPPN